MLGSRFDLVARLHVSEATALVPDRSTRVTGPPPLPAPVSDAMTASSGRGCPICRYTLEAGERFFTWFAIEYSVDPTMIERLRAGGGMCPPHTRRIMRQPGAGTRLTTLYRHVLPALRDRLAAGRPATGTCPACERDTQATAAALESLVRSLTSQAAAAGYGGSDGVCLPHLRQAQDLKPNLLGLFTRTAAARLSNGERLLARLAGPDQDIDERSRLRKLLPAGGMFDETPADPADTLSRLCDRLLAGTCPCCLAAGQHERRYLTWLASQVHGDPASLANEPGNVCPRHLHDLVTTDRTAGGWALRREQVRWVARLSDALVGSRRTAYPRVRAALQDEACLVCRAMTDAGTSETALLLAALAGEPMRTAYERTPGMCLRHAGTLPMTEPVRALVRQVAVARTDLLIAELNEAARKTAWLSRHEGKGPESTAWARATALIDGRVFLGGLPRTQPHPDPEPTPDP